MISSLNPNSLTPKGEQYAIAWAALNNNDAEHSYTPEQCAHAKCWLTYRAIDGEISFHDWETKIFPIGTGDIESPGMAERWRSSQMTAEIYLLILNGLPDWMEFAEIAFRCLTTGAALILHPGTATNYMRTMALFSYALYLNDAPTFKAAAEESILAWRKMWQSVDPAMRPMRYAEVANDAAPLYVMSRLLTLDKPSEPWADNIVSAQASTPWGRCLIELGVHPRRLWSAKAVNSAGSKVGLYKELHAAQKYGTGSMSEGFKKQLLGLLPPILPGDHVIDFGCGQSQDAKKLWPQAKVRRYDPAIPGIDQLPEVGHHAGLCFEVMEHIPEDEVVAVLNQMKNLAPVWAITVHTGPAAQRLATGENAHCTQRPTEWWMGRFREVFTGKELRHIKINDQRFLLIIT